MKKRWRLGLIWLATAIAAGPFVAPELLAFPYQEDFGDDRVWSTAPIPRERMAAILADANTRVATSPLAVGSEGRRIFLTDGGWRWKWLALQHAGAFGLTRAFREDVLLNRSNLATGTVLNGREIGGARNLAGVIAHEKCHGMERRRYGNIAIVIKPNWLIEGYCDHVAQDSSLSEADYAALKARGEKRPAMVYYEGRRRVAATLAANGGDVDALFGRDRLPAIVRAWLQFW